MLLLSQYWRNSESLQDLSQQVLESRQMPVQDQITIATYFAQKSEVVPHIYGADFGCETSSRNIEQLDVDNIPDAAPFRNGRSFWYGDKTMQAEVQRQAVINSNRQEVLSVLKQAQWRITHLHVALMALKLVAILQHAEASTALRTALCALMANQLLSVAMNFLAESVALHHTLIRQVLKQPTMPFAKYQANVAFIALGLLMPDEDDVLSGAVAAEYLKQGGLALITLCMKAESSASESAAIFLQSNLMRHLLLTGQAAASMHALARMKGALLCSEFFQPYLTRAEQHLDPLVSFKLDADARQHAADDPELQLGTLLQTACLVNLVLDHSTSAEGPRTTRYPLMPPDGWSGIARRGISPELEAQVKGCSREVLAMNTQDFAQDFAQDFGQSSEGHSSEGYSSELGSSSAASSDNAGSAHRTQQPLVPSKAAKMLPTPTAASWEEVNTIAARALCTLDWAPGLAQSYGDKPKAASEDAMDHMVTDRVQQQKTRCWTGLWWLFCKHAALTIVDDAPADWADFVCYQIQEGTQAAGPWSLEHCTALIRLLWRFRIFCSEHAAVTNLVGEKVQTMLKNVWSHLCELVEDHDLRCHVLWATYSWYGLEQPLQGNCNDAHLKGASRTLVDLLLKLQLPVRFSRDEASAGGRDGIASTSAQASSSSAACSHAYSMACKGRDTLLKFKDPDAAPDPESTQDPPVVRPYVKMLGAYEQMFPERRIKAFRQHAELVVKCLESMYSSRLWQPQLVDLTPDIWCSVATAPAALQQYLDDPHLANRLGADFVRRIKAWFRAPRMHLLSCPISKAFFLNPVIAADGHTYEKAAITEWLQEHQSSPVTGETLLHRRLLPNTLIKQAVANQVSI
ncbi:hypothetical protein WJX82_003439 [Trebouxia sp. C0006]